MNKQVRIDGVKYNVESDDQDQYLDHVGNDFEPYMVELFKKLISSNDVIIDVGANIGLTSILFAKLGQKVISYEASPTTYQILCNNIENNKLTNITPVNYGLGDENKVSSITFASNNRSGGFVSDQIRPSIGHTTENIIIKKLDDLWREQLDEEELNFVKIDVEGFEGQVIKGASAVFKKNKPIVVLELNHWCLNAFHRITIPDFFDMLRMNFPFLYAVDTDNKTINDLHDNNQAYQVMYKHIIHFGFPNIVAGFDDKILKKLRE